MKRSIAAISLGGGLQEKLYAIAAAGFAMVDLSESDVLLSDMKSGEIRQLLDEVGLRVCAYQLMSDIESVSDSAFDMTLQRMRRKFDLMHELGAPLLLISANGSANAIKSDELAAKRLGLLAELASGQSIRIAYEATASARHVRNVADAWNIVQRVNHPDVGIVLDSFEALVEGRDNAVLWEIPGDRIFLVQLADVPGLQVDPITLGRHFRSFPGQGTLGIADFVSRVIDRGYSGVFSLEVLNDAIRAAPVRQTALDAARSLTYVEEQMYPIGKSLEFAAFTKCEPPPLPLKESIKFIEFAVSSDENQRLAQWLEMLGFAKAGTHRNKAVDLYRQGDVLILLNAGSDTFAHYYHHLHGTSVCAIGMTLSNPTDVLKRALLYQYKHYEERRDQQEYAMPAVRSPDGSLVHLLGRDYSPAQDFELQGGNSDTSIGIQRIDHVARAVPASQMGAWVLFYRTMLGLVVEQSLNIADPHGVVSSTAFRDRANHLRLPLTCSENTGTVIARALTNFGGAGVNQIAFETDDIFSTVAAILANGMPLLKIPANYYRNLQEDRGVSRDLVRRLEEANLLYDADGKGGEFFHAYTDLFDGRFFFEIVQRTGGYDRYGEVNSPVRLAVQTKHKVRRSHHSPLM